MSSIGSQRSLRSTSSCSTFSDATTLVDEPSLAVAGSATTTSISSHHTPSYQCTVSTFGSSSWAKEETNYTTPTISPIRLSHLSEPSSPSQLVQFICKVFPNCSLAKKMRNAEEDGEKLIEKMTEERKEKREKEIETLLARDRLMAEEFGRLGW